MLIAPLVKTGLEGASMGTALRVAALIAICFLYGCSGQPRDIEITEKSEEAEILLQFDTTDDLWYKLELT
jgi:hypothetical protein